MAQHYEQLSNFGSPVVWVQCSKGQLLPKGLSPVFGGLSVENGEPIYVARARHETRHYQGGSGGHPACTGVSRPRNGTTTRSTRSSSSSSSYSSREIVRSQLIPGRLVPSEKKCYVGHGFKEHSYSRYQVLTNPFRVQLEWMPARGHVPDGALLGGQAARLKYYIGSVYHDGFAISGKIICGSKELWIATGGKELNLNIKYEVLVDIEKMANTNQQLLNHGVTM